MQDARTADRIVTDIGHHLATHPPVASIDEILRRFLVEMSKLD